MGESVQGCVRGLGVKGGQQGWVRMCQRWDRSGGAHRALPGQLLVSLWSWKYSPHVWGRLDAQEGLSCLSGLQ